MIKNKVVIIVFLSILFLVSCNNGKKTAYVELITVHDQFEYTKELKSKLLEIQNTGEQLKKHYENIVDSLYSILDKTKDNNVKANILKDIEVVKIDYQRKENDFLQSYKLQVQKFDEQIWSRINVFVTEYGKKNGYDYIFGADGTGGLMYSDSTNNITSDVITYINNKYQDKE